MQTQRKISLVFQMGFAALLTFPATTFAQQSWTHTAAACTVDEGSVAKHELTGARFRFKSDGQTIGDIYARCNIANPRDDGFSPGWNTLQVVYSDERLSGNYVRALLYKVHNHNGGVSLVVPEDQTFSSLSFGAKPDGGMEAIGFAHSFDFYNYSYFVMLHVHREDARYNPGISTIRLWAPPPPPPCPLCSLR
jgi:hypothetical protein